MSIFATEDHPVIYGPGPMGPLLFVRWGTQTAFSAVVNGVVRMAMWGGRPAPRGRS